MITSHVTRLNLSCRYSLKIKLFYPSILLVIAIGRCLCTWMMKNHPDWMPSMASLNSDINSLLVFVAEHRYLKNNPQG